MPINHQSDDDDHENAYGPLMAAMSQRQQQSDWQPFSEDNWEQEMEQIPLFMKSMVPASASASNPAMEAIQSLVYDGTPEGKCMKIN